MDRDTIDHIIGQLADIIVTFEHAMFTTGCSPNQGAAWGHVAQARVKLIEDQARLPSEALCEVQE